MGEGNPREERGQGQATNERQKQRSLQTRLLERSEIDEMTDERKGIRGTVQVTSL